MASGERLWSNVRLVEQANPTKQPSRRLTYHAAEIAIAAEGIVLGLPSVLSHPDFSLPFILDTDSSQAGLGAVLSQETAGQLKVIAYADKTLSRSERPERRYWPWILLASISDITCMGTRLFWERTIVRWNGFWISKTNSCQVAKRIELHVLGTCDLDIRHQHGSKHGYADSLSRHPCIQCGFSENVEAYRANEDDDKPDIPEGEHKVDVVSTSPSLLKSPQ